MSTMDLAVSRRTSPAMLPLYDQVKQKLLRDLHRGVYRAGQQIPTEADLCKRFKVSRITIRRALGELISEGMLASERGRGTFVASEPFSTALCVLFVCASEMSMSYPYTSHLVEGMQSYTSPGRQFRFEMVALPDTNLQSPEDSTISDLTAQGRFDGIVALPRILPRQMQRLADHGTPVVQVGGSYVQSPPEHAMLIDCGPQSAVCIALEHLKSVGRKKVGLLGASLQSSQSGKKQLYTHMQSVGLEINETRFERSAYGMNGGYDATHQLLSRCDDVDAILACDDLQAAGALRALAERNLRVPDDVAVVGLGNWLSDHSHCGLTTIDIGLAEHGNLAMQVLDRVSRHEQVERQYWVQPRLIRRETA